MDAVHFLFLPAFIVIGNPLANRCRPLHLWRIGVAVMHLVVSRVHISVSSRITSAPASSTLNKIHKLGLFVPNSPSKLVKSRSFPGEPPLSQCWDGNGSDAARFLLREKGPIREI